MRRGHVQFGRAVVGLLCALWCAQLGGCESDLGPPPSGVSVTGTVTYSGEAAAKFAQPAILVLAQMSLEASEDQPLPHALFTLREPDFGKPVSYELRFLQPGSYFVLAILGDIADFEGLGSPTGGYPNGCTIATMAPERSIDVEDKPLENIDIALFDSITNDPCFAGGSSDAGADSGADADSDGNVPMEGTATVEATIDSPGSTPETGDTLSLSLFLGQPGSDDPDFVEIVEPTSFPTTITIPDVPPGDYTIAICFKKSDSESPICSGPGDRKDLIPSLTGKVEVPADEVFELDVVLED